MHPRRAASEGLPAAEELRRFRETVWAHYRAHGRSLPWRQSTDPYAVLVSEFMLQQTQVSRVERAYPRFMRRFPTIKSLAGATLEEVLKEWRGLGYDRRALHLKRAAETIERHNEGRVPRDLETLLRLPGVGRSTAGAVAAFAFGEAHAFLETNVRTVVIHHFFSDGQGVEDRDIMAVVKATLDHERVREWYWALMDYGSYLKRIDRGVGRRAKAHRSQPPFAGSTRELRSRILRRVLEEPGISAAELCAPPEGMGEAEDGAHRRRVLGVLGQLEREGFVVEDRNAYRLT